MRCNISNAATVRTLMGLSPRSMHATVLACIPSASASCACVKPSAERSAARSAGNIGRIRQRPQPHPRFTQGGGGFLHHTAPVETHQKSPVRFRLLNMPNAVRVLFAKVQHDVLRLRCAMILLSRRDSVNPYLTEAAA